VDFQDNIVLKENYSFLVADAHGAIHGDEKGLYDHDTRFLSRYAWDLGPGFQTLLTYYPQPDTFRAHHAQIEGPEQKVAVRRELKLRSRRLIDTLTIENTSLEERSVHLRLFAQADFIDLFEARGWFEPTHPTPTCTIASDSMTFEYTAADALNQATHLEFRPAPERLADGRAEYAINLPPHGSTQITVHSSIRNPIDSDRAGPAHDTWRTSFAELTQRNASPALAQAIDDLRSLLLITEHGPVPAAGIPWYVAAFGRDALLTSHLLLPDRPDVAEGTLRYLARLQATTEDSFRAAQPGKIPHEIRFGELARTGTIPHSPYFGTVDATPLFVMLLAAHAEATQDAALIRELRPNWEAALAWMTGPADPDGDGFLEFESEPQSAGSGLTIQSWKDSSDSMSHADGTLATGAIAVSEVQGYAYAAYRAAAGFYRQDHDTQRARAWDHRAAALKEAFHSRFWMDDHGTYAMALDGAKRPLRVKNSDAGQLLWTGIVPTDVAPRLVAALFGPESYSGWGFRTLGANERRYNPVSYHNGSVWPHDTALITAGLQRYGFMEEATKVAQAVLDLAERQADRRLPELVAGYPRQDAPPVPYPVACRPQAWDAAAIIFLARLLLSSGKPHHARCVAWKLDSVTD
jgi:glycogen debranching enzyme